TSSPTTSSCSARSRASPARSSASAGAARATRSRRGSGACSPSSRSRPPPPTTSPALIQPDSRKGASSMRPSSRTLQQRLAEGVVLGAEGYVFELERRGYVKAGPVVPEVILDEHRALMQLHRELLRAGADVMVALTYYAHRGKLANVGRADDLE